MNHTVIYTAIFGDEVTLYPQHNFEGFDFICFTDRHREAKGWRVIVVDEFFKGDPVRNNRYYKILPHYHLKDYQQSIYIDGNFVVVKSPKLLIEMLKSHKMLVFNHAETTKDPRNCIYDEYQAIQNLYELKGIKKDDFEVIEKQINFFRGQDYPKENGLIKGGVLIRNHHDPDVIRAMERWWYFISNFSKRDQLSFNFVAWEQKFEFHYLKGDIRRGNPWFYMISKADKNLKLSLLKLKIRSLFGKA